ncbi:unnamed protein product [Amaranthus hypochondriacus]
MFEFGKLLPTIGFIIPLFLLIIIKKYVFFSTKTPKNTQFKHPKLPKCYPLIGHFIASYKHELNDSRFEWLASLIINSPSNTFTIQLPFLPRTIFTGNPANVEHILKTRFSTYTKGSFQNNLLRDFLGDGIFNVDGEKWKFQRKVASFEFSTKSLRNFVENVVDFELFDRLIPILSNSSTNRTVLDLQDVLQRFAFDNICKIAFGYDPEYLLPNFPHAKFAVAFDTAAMITSSRFRALFPVLWKICRFLDIGLEHKLKDSIFVVRQFANSVVRQKKQQILENTDGFSDQDLLSRFLNSSYTDEKFVTDIVISFIIAGRDTTSAALTWFFWVLHKNNRVEEEIMKDIDRNRGKQSKKTENLSVFDEVKDMVYLHAALCESMRLYPPVPTDTKEATEDDILPDGTRVQKGNRVTYHPFAMGRMESIWGSDWAEYRPERWLELEDGEEGKWRFVPRDPYSYPVFQAGPRICLGKEMAFLQMKRVVIGVLERFRVVPVLQDSTEPVFRPHLTAKMVGGLPVKIEERRR